MKIILTFNFDDKKLDIHLKKENVTREEFAKMIQGEVLPCDKDMQELGATVSVRVEN